MEAVWFAIVSAMLAVYVVLDGFDFAYAVIFTLSRASPMRETISASGRFATPASPDSV